MYKKKKKDVIIYAIMGKEIDEKTLAAAKEKLACKIEPATYGDGSASGASSHAPAGPQNFIDPSGKVLLTQMTSAGG